MGIFTPKIKKCYKSGFGFVLFCCWREPAVKYFPAYCCSPLWQKCDPSQLWINFPSISFSRSNICILRSFCIVHASGKRPVSSSICLPWYPLTYSYNTIYSSSDLSFHGGNYQSISIPHPLLICMLQSAFHYSIPMSQSWPCRFTYFLSTNFCTALSENRTVWQFYHVILGQGSTNSDGLSQTLSDQAWLVITATLLLLYDVKGVEECWTLSFFETFPGIWGRHLHCSDCQVCQGGWFLCPGTLPEVVA